MLEEANSMLEGKVAKLSSENNKLQADVKILKDEHSEILHSLFAHERKNQSLAQENQILK